MSKAHSGAVIVAPTPPQGSAPDKDAGLITIKKNKLPASFFTPPVIELIAMHKYMRPAGSKHEKLFCEHYLGGMPGVVVDPADNWVGVIPNKDGTAPRVMWSSHTDTVHRQSGTQKLEISATKLRLAKTEKIATCLGADCTVGVWIMRQMYLAGIPGLYIWHAEEECGGHGSSYIATKRPELLTHTKIAIAFDRRGKTSIITHQGSKRTASDTFAKALGAQLGEKYEPDQGGTFTDTANYAKLVPECTNVSVGYDGAHSSSEATCLVHAYDLLQACLKLDVDALPVERDPTKVEYRTYGGVHYGGGRWGGWSDGDGFYGDWAFEGGAWRRRSETANTDRRHAGHNQPSGDLFGKPADKPSGNPYSRIEVPDAQAPSAKDRLSQTTKELIIDAMAEHIAKNTWTMARALYDAGWTLAQVYRLLRDK